MKYAILKSFPYSHDGIHPVMMVVGGPPQEIRPDLVGGLVAAGLIGEGESIDLSKMTVPQLLELAAGRKVDLGDATKKADIVAAIELHDEAGS